MNCGTCKWWINTAEQLGMSESVRKLYGPEPKVEDTLDKAPGVWGYCNKVSMITVQDPDRKFYVHDASEYMAKLGTRSDFGCTEHEVA